MPLPEPRASAPVMFGATWTGKELLPWVWAEERLVHAVKYWVTTAPPDGRPHSRPVWAVWLPDGL